MARTLNTKDYVKRRRKLTPEEQIQQSEVEIEINKLNVGESTIVTDYGRGFKARIRMLITRIEGKEFTTSTPENKGIFIITRLS